MKTKFKLGDIVRMTDKAILSVFNIDSGLEYKDLIVSEIDDYCLYVQDIENPVFEVGYFAAITDDNELELIYRGE